MVFGLPFAPCLRESSDLGHTRLFRYNACEKKTARYIQTETDFYYIENKKNMGGAVADVFNLVPQKNEAHYSDVCLCGKNWALIFIYFLFCS